MSSFNDRTADLLGEVLDAAARLSASAIPMTVSGETYTIPAKYLKELDSAIPMTVSGETYTIPAKYLKELDSAITNYNKERGSGSVY